MSGEVWAGVCAVGVAVLSATVLMIRYIVTQKQIFREAEKNNRMQANYRQEVLESQVEVQKQAFERVGSELYDNIGQMLSVAKMYLYSLEETELSQEQRTFIQQTNDIVGKSITDLRGVIRHLEGYMAQDFDLQECVRQYLQRVRKNYKVITELQVTGAAYALDYEKEIVLFKVIQEIITAIFNESKASYLTVKLRYDPTPLMIVVESDGQALSDSKKKQRNAVWQDIQRRTKLIGGKCTLVSKAGIGTRVTLEKNIN
ncbi:MAG: histidine kinase [Spirosomataceae bacterium]